jgi:glucose/arabinose dehydrogenase
MRPALLALLFWILILPAAAGPAPGSIPPVRLKPVASGFVQPVFFTEFGGRFYVVEQAGRILVQEGRTWRTFLDIRGKVKAGGEMGLLGLAFHRDGRFFVNYTARSEGRLWTRIAEFRRPEAGAERLLLTFRQPYENHNGGMLAFGPDGYLYIGTGDGGSGNDPQNFAQSLDTLLGKILRLDVNRADPGRAYAIPADNPFVQRRGARPEIYAYGLRNPWRFSFDRATGLLWCGDVGQNSREEIDIIQKGGNYGWRVMEGTIRTPGISDRADVGRFLGPVIDYGRSDGYCVTGGYVYRGRRYPSLRGVYLYGDFGSTNLWGLRYESGRLWARRLLLRTGLAISSFGEDEEGEVYVVDYGGGLYRIEAP